MFYDPYNEDIQTRFERTDRTGRINPLHVPRDTPHAVDVLLMVLALSIIAWLVWYVS